MAFAAALGNSAWVPGSALGRKLEMLVFIFCVLYMFMPKLERKALEAVFRFHRAILLLNREHILYDAYNLPPSSMHGQILNEILA